MHYKMGMNRRLLTGLGVAATAGAFGAVDLADRRRIAADPKRGPLFEHLPGRSQTVVSRDGTRLHVESFGPEDAPPVVLVHGWTCALRFWRLQVRDLMRDHHVIAYDLRGHGESGSAEGEDWSPDAMADDLQAVLEQCAGDRPALLGGHSLGAMTIVAWAGRHPDEVTGRAAAVALMNTGLGDLVSESLIVRTPKAMSHLDQALGAALLGAAAPLPPWPSPLTHRAVRYIALSSQASPAEVRFCEELLLAVKPRVRAGFGRELSRLDLRERVEHLTVPTLVLAGCADRLTPPVHARELEDALPEPSGLIELEGAGHMCPIERAPDVTAALRDLAGRHLAPKSVAQQTTF
jgi:pimeloyl-ACP methyl ester carboxylesterase